MGNVCFPGFYERKPIVNHFMHSKNFALKMGIWTNHHNSVKVSIYCPFKDLNYMYNIQQLLKLVFSIFQLWEHNNSS
jgi:hypothetical protein